jgi:hypothetical protein
MHGFRNIQVYNRLLSLSRVACALVLASTLIICNAGRSQSTAAKPVSHTLYLDDVTGEIEIPSWRLIGLFHLQPPDADSQAQDPNGFQRDYLGRLGYPERSLTAQTVESLCSGRSICRWYSPHGAAIPLYTLARESTPAVAYAFAQITCAHDLDLAIEFDSSEELAIWVNGSLLRMNSPGRKGGTAIKYLNFEPIHLHEGENNIVFKSDRVKEGKQWAIMASLMPMQNAREHAVVMNYGYFLENRLLKKGEPIAIESPPLCQHEDSVVTIVDRDNNAVVTRRNAGFPISIQTANLQPGYYRASLVVSGRTIQDDFYIGDPDGMYGQLLSLKEKSGASGPLAPLIDPIIRRYAILTSQQYSHPAEADWQKKLLLVLKDGSEYVDNGYDARVAQSAGFHLREYKSAIDQTMQYYLFYIPEGHAANMPLVVEMPYAVSTQRPFLESALAIGWPKALDNLKLAADKSGVSTAIVNGRGSVGDAPIGEADVLEAINDVLSHYSIDRQKIYLFGTSAGGYRALMLAEHNPDFFAAVGVYGPGLGVPPLAQPLEDQQLHTGVFSQSTRLSVVPVKILEGEYDYEPSRQILEEFFNELRQGNSASEMTLLKDGMHGTSDAESLLFPWFVRFAAVKQSNFLDTVNEAISKVH